MFKIYDKYIHIYHISENLCRILSVHNPFIQSSRKTEHTYRGESVPEIGNLKRHGF